ncbi:MAG: threo-3-hydroxy-L-aspartate ammonia-lyase [Acidobacteria bacterium]|nr:threo-3-hydroxy-L-aspartate ammonia-lyase [Acidobacteriota bacterium]
MPVSISAAEVFPQIELAAERLAEHANVTPIHRSRTLDQRIGARVFLKCENFQRVGAFKFRGAYNAMSQLSPAERAAGVLTYSSGNHAQGVALAGKLLGIPTTIVMPTNAPKVKRAATEGYGARIVEYDPKKTTRREVAKELASEGEFTLIPPFDHLQILAGQGTAALEFHRQVPDLDLFLAPVGGGGLMSGCAVATKGVAPSCRVIGVEPEVADDATRSFKTGRLHTIKNPPTIADGTRTQSLGEHNFPLFLECVDDMVTVSEEAIKEAVRFLFQRLKLVVEPSGALGIAALLSGAVEPGARTGVLISGGNVDPEVLAEILGG